MWEVTLEVPMTVTLRVGGLSEEDASARALAIAHDRGATPWECLPEDTVVVTATPAQGGLLR